MLLTGQNQIKALAADGNFVDPKTVIEGIYCEAEFERAQAVVAEQNLVRRYAHFRCAHFQPGHRAHLVAFGIGHHRGQPPHRTDGHFKNRFQVGAGDVEIDLTAAADGAAEQAGLADETEGAGLFEHRNTNGIDQLPGTLRLHRNRADKGIRAQRDKKETLHFGRPTGLGFRAGLARP